MSFSSYALPFILSSLSHSFYLSSSFSFSLSLSFFPYSFHAPPSFISSHSSFLPFLPFTSLPTILTLLLSSTSPHFPTPPPLLSPPDRACPYPSPFLSLSPSSYPSLPFFTPLFCSTLLPACPQPILSSPSIAPSLLPVPLPILLTPPPFLSLSPPTYPVPLPIQGIPCSLSM